MKSYHEWTLLCSVFTLGLLCSDHFQWFIHDKFSVTKLISPPASRCRRACILRFTAVFFSFFCLFDAQSLRSLNGSQANLDIWHYDYDCYEIIYYWHYENLVRSLPDIYHPRAWGKNRLSGTDFEIWPKISVQRNIVSTIEKKLVNLQWFPYMPPNLANFGPQTAKNDLRVYGPPPKVCTHAGRAASSHLRHISV